MSTPNEILEVSKNIIKMIKYRGQTLLSELLSDDKIITLTNSFSYLQIQAKKGDRQVVYLLTAPDSNVATKSNDFEKMINSLGQRLQKGCDITVITNNKISSHLERKLAEIRTTYPLIYLECRPYKLFYICVPEHNLVSPHRIATKEEIDNYCLFMGVTKDDFPIISIDDPMAIWLGLRRNDVVAIRRISENVGETEFFRICK